MSLTDSTGREEMTFIRHRKDRIQDTLLHELEDMTDSWPCTTLNSMIPKVGILLGSTSWAVVIGTLVSSSCIGLEKEDSQHSLVQMPQSKPLKPRIQ